MISIVKSRARRKKLKAPAPAASGKWVVEIQPGYYLANRRVWPGTTKELEHAKRYSSKQLANSVLVRTANRWGISAKDAVARELKEVLK